MVTAHSARCLSWAVQRLVCVLKDHFKRARGSKEGSEEVVAEV